ncbi:MAG TPA: hypothetical protein VGS28_00435 [Candidatus Saccharimonadales bacterium]|nr:hypothetical protein [Candidatus Saccharimonadales bacterium]
MAESSLSKLAIVYDVRRPVPLGLVDDGIARIEAAQQSRSTVGRLTRLGMLHCELGQAGEGSVLMQEAMGQARAADRSRHPVQYNAALRRHAQAWMALGYPEMAWRALGMIVIDEDTQVGRGHTHFLGTEIAEMASPLRNVSVELGMRTVAATCWAGGDSVPSLLAGINQHKLQSRRLTPVRSQPA